ncbi:hypothetical protein ADJ70_06770 [Olsenella sp. oral taxon 807]|nr:hypothetical protein ADJ70_06770 [Olsenella sp. oral taxon 807]
MYATVTPPRPCAPGEPPASPPDPRATGRAGDGGIRDLPWREGRGPEPWDAVPYGRGNPLAADVRGAFSWEVSEGWWQVRVEAEGYWPAQSEWVRMPAATEPDLQIGLRPASLPQPGGAARAGLPVLPAPLARLGEAA